MLKRLPICLFSGWHRHLPIFHSIWPLSSINHQCTNLLLHQLTTHLFIHRLCPHLSNPYSIYTLMHFPNVTAPIYLFKPSIHSSAVNPSTNHPSSSLWQAYLFTKTLQGNENLCCYFFRSAREALSSYF